MKAVILAGGFAKRLGALAENTPKPLLPIAGKPVIEYILRKIEAIKDIDMIYIQTNKKFEMHFSEELKKIKTKKEIKLVIEPAMEEREKIGAIGAWEFLIRKENINDDLLSVSGDNLFEFNLKKFIDFYKEKGTVVIGLYDVGRIEEARKLGIAQIDKNNRIIGFEEKPENPKSTLASTGIYIYPKEKLKLILKYLSEGNNPDAPGYFLMWLYKRETVHGFTFSEKWFDIGSIETYEEANRYYEKKLHSGLS
jgi:glucose-1-phosphate thymidylyltransferase